MLKIAPARSAKYYGTREFARDDYYSERNACPGQWIGAGAADLGLSGAPQEGQLGALLEGTHPATGEPLNPRAQAVTNAGFDLTFSPGKDVSVLLALGDQRVREVILAAQEQGVRHGLAYLEANECWVRRGKAGADKQRGRGFIGATYTHEMSRAGDPHLHTHCVIANKVQGEDGRYTAPHMHPTFRGAAGAGRIHEAVVRSILARELGLRFAREEGGQWRIVGVPEDLCRTFSKRGIQMAELEEALGLKTPAGRDVVARMTRGDKPLADREEVKARWVEETREQGHDPERILAEALGREPAGRERLHGTQAGAPAPTEAQLAAQLFGRHGLCVEAATFDRRAVIAAVADAYPEGLEGPAVEAIADRLIATHAIEVAPAAAHDPAAYTATYTAPDLLAAEAQLVEMAETPPDVAPAPLADADVDAVLADHDHLGEDQAEAVRHLLTATGRVAIVEALAGTGKTTAMAAAVEGWGRAGVPVVGAALSGQAAQQLERDSGVPSHTIARLIEQGRRGQEPIPAGAVVLVDEASMVGTHQLAELARTVAERGGRLALVGDRGQLPSIEAGGALAALADRIGAASLDTMRRQRTPLQRQVAEHLAHGRAEDAIALLSEHGRLATFADVGAVREQLLADWIGAGGAATPADHLILAHDRGDVTKLNEDARKARDRAGQLGDERLSAGGREWAVGDRLLCLRNDYRQALDVRNGTRGNVVALDPEAGTLTVERDDGRGRVSLPADYLAEHADYAYAATVHKTQGGSAEHVYLLAHPAQGGREWGYTAGSRQRTDLRAYVFDPEGADRIAQAEAERDEEAALETERTAEEQLREQATAALVDGWTDSHAKSFALDQVEDEKARAAAIAAARENLSGLDLRQLAEARAQVQAEIARREAARARDLRAASDQVKAAGERAAQAQAEAAAAERRAAQAEAERQATSRRRAGERRRLEEEARAERQAAERARAEASSWRARRDALTAGEGARAQRELQDQHEERIAQASARERAIADRLAARAGLAEQVNPSPETERFLGPRPGTPTLRAAWERAACQVGAYRARYELGDEGPGIGTAPADERQAEAWRAAAEAAGPVRERAVDQLKVRLAVEDLEPAERAAVEAWRDDLRQDLGAAERARDLERKSEGRERDDQDLGRGLDR